jgi:hypothetical protein
VRYRWFHFELLLLLLVLQIRFALVTVVVVMRVAVSSAVLRPLSLWEGLPGSLPGCYRASAAAAAAAAIEVSLGCVSPSFHRCSPPLCLLPGRL